jgi:glutamyl/glutaminyl-tRNA synthetase
MDVGRFAPSTTGPAHPGTLLAALLCWLDARSRGARLLLRLEDLDPERCRPEHALGLREDLAWLGLDFDAVESQHEAAARHAVALDRLAATGRLYPCTCSRAEVLAAAAGRLAPDGSALYAGTCRERALPAGGWRAADAALRVRLPAGAIELRDESGIDLGQDPSVVMGDPVVRRRDGAVAYQLAVVVDDAASGVTRVVRGRDLAPSTATQVALQRLLGLPRPAYRHHLLLLEERPDGGEGRKLAKLHGAVSAEALRGVYDARALCGLLAFAAGLEPSPAPASPGALLPRFDWSRVAHEDRVVRWTGAALVVLGPAGAVSEPRAGGS